MTLDLDIAAAERTEAARRLIAQAQADIVDLVTVSSLELCVLGGPKQPLFEEPVARAWLQLGNRQRRKLMDEITAGMVERGLLIEDQPEGGRRQRGSTYSLKPQLGLMLAARCRPSSVVVTETMQADLRSPRFFALGDQNEPILGVVIEEPVELPSDIAGNFRQVKKFGPLGWFYRYVLVSQDEAAEMLAELTMSPPKRAGAVEAPGWTVAAFYPGSANPSGERVSVVGDGTTARLDGLGLGNGSQAGTEYHAEGVRTVMLHLIAGPVQ
jgi:hypothetical protein